MYTNCTDWMMPLVIPQTGECVAECPPNMKRGDDGKGMHCEF